MTIFSAPSRLKLTLAGIGMSVVLAGLAATAAQADDRITVEKNHTKRITLPASAGAVIVGNPEIADVNIVDSRTIYIMGKGFGSSTVTVTGHDGRPLFDADVIVTTAQASAITVYKGLKPSLMVCSTVCLPEDVGAVANGLPRVQATDQTPAPMVPMAAIGQ